MNDAGVFDLDVFIKKIEASALPSDFKEKVIEVMRAPPPVDVEEEGLQLQYTKLRGFLEANDMDKAKAQHASIVRDTDAYVPKPPGPSN